MQLAVEHLTKYFRSSSGEASVRIAAVDDLSFTVEEGQFFTLLGPSGCGKTTTLRSIAGLETPSAGTIRVGDRVLHSHEDSVDVPVNSRGLGMVFQSYAIWPHMNVFRNVAFPLEVAPRAERPSKAEIKKRVHEALAVVHMEEISSRRATNLSGGQQQRLALARALVMRPPLLLLDEPLSNLDAKLREEMRFELKRLQQTLGITTLYVTHDQVEALAMSDRIGVMNKGRFEQVGTPTEIYNRPSTHFVADFIGASNFIPAQVVEPSGAGAYLVRTVAGEVVARSSVSYVPGDRALVAVRPENVALEPGVDGGRATGRWPGRVRAAAFLGETVDHVVSVGEVEIQARCNPRGAVAVDEDVTVSFAASETWLVPLEEEATRQAPLVNTDVAQALDPSAGASAGSAS